MNANLTVKRRFLNGKTFKLIDYFYEALDFLNSSETNTIAKFKLKKKQEQKAREKAQQNGGATTPPPKTSSSKKFEMEVLEDE